MTALPDRVRETCAWVTGRAESVRIEAAAIEAYAAALPAPGELPPPDPSTHFDEGDREARAAFVICLDAINFGSGWWPTISKRPGRSGYFTVAAAVTDRFRESGPWGAAELSALDAAAIAAVLGQDPAHPLMTDFAASLRDVGARVLADHRGSFAAVVDAAAGSAPALAELLAGWRPSPTPPYTEGARCRSSSAPRSPPPTSIAPASPPSPTSTGSPPSPTTSSRTSSASTASSASTRT
jgi:hypothetical protein